MKFKSVARRIKKTKNKLSVVNTRDLLNSQQISLMFVEDLEAHGCNERGEKLQTHSWFLEAARLLADLRLKEVYTSGAAQIGKSLLNAHLQTWLTVRANANTLYTFLQENMLNRMVPLQFKPLFNQWMETYHIKSNPENSKNNKLMQSERGAAIYSYVNTTKVGGNTDGKAAAGGAIVSFATDIAFCDEVSKYPDGSIDPVYRRLDNSRVDTQPMRFVGTPGSGRGIESQIEKADRDFYPHVRCEHCGEVIPLHPLGMLFKSERLLNESGEFYDTYFSPSGKPLSWYHSDITDPINSAYFACNHCDNKVSDAVRTTAWFQCLKTGQRLDEFLDNLDGDSGYIWKVGITFSPLLRQTRFNLASDIVRGGLETTNPEDWQQQRLGVPYLGDSGNLTIQQIQRAITPIPSQPNGTTVTLAGLDQGRSYDYLAIVKFHLPINHRKLSMIQIWDSTIREVKLLSPIERYQLADLCDKYNVSTGVIDNEPDITNASALARELDWILCDQKSNQKDDIKQIIVRDGGEEFDCCGIRNSLFLQRVRLNFTTNFTDSKPLYRLPDVWNKYIYDTTEMSPARHVTAIGYDRATGTWMRPKDHVDDLYYALVFSEVAFRLYLEDYNQSEWYKFI